MRQLSSIVILETSFHLFRELLDIGTMNNIYIYIHICYNSIHSAPAMVSIIPGTFHPPHTFCCCCNFIILSWRSSATSQPRSQNPWQKHINSWGRPWIECGMVIIRDIKWTYPWNLTNQNWVWISMANLDITAGIMLNPRYPANRIWFGHIPLYNTQGWLPQVHCSWYQNWYLHEVPIMLCIWVCLNILWTHKKCHFKSDSNDYSNHCFLWGIVVNILRQIT